MLIATKRDRATLCRQRAGVRRARLSRNDAVDLGSAPASGAVGRALAAHCVHQIRSVRGARRGSARGRAEQQPRRLRSPLNASASFRLSVDPLVGEVCPYSLKQNKRRESAEGQEFRCFYDVLANKPAAPVGILNRRVLALPCACSVLSHWHWRCFREFGSALNHRCLGILA